MTGTSLDSAGIQRRYFEHADADRFHWTTGCKGFAETEDALLRPFLETLEAPCLEIGCGEGNNLVRLQSCGPCFGVDLFRAKLHFAAREVPGSRLSSARAEALPFPDAVFSTVFIRDLLHHVPDPEVTLAESVRVLRPGGRLCLFEPNGGNPLVRLQTYLIRAEINARHFRPERIEAWLRPLPLQDVRIAAAQPFPIRRLVLHYRFGWPGLGRWAPVRASLAALERAAAKILPVSRWACITATARRTPR